MPMRKVQHTPGGPVLVGWLVGNHMDPILRKALPGWSIYMSDTTTLVREKALAEVRQARYNGGSPVNRLYITGFSGGCQSVREVLLSDEGRGMVCGVAVFDGTHGSIPPAAWQVDVWRDCIDRARAGEVRFIATCTSMGYTERLPLGERFASTRTILEVALGESLEVGRPVVAGPGGMHMHIERFPSKDIDKEAHIRQQREVMPDLLHRLWVAQDPSTVLDCLEDVAEGAADVVADVAGWLAGWVGERSAKVEALAWCVQEFASQAARGKESARVKEYFSTPKFLRFDPKTGKETPIKISTGDWCAAAIAMSHHHAGLSWVKPRLAGIEYERDAIDLGRWAGKAPTIDPDVEPGDLAIFPRGTGWTRHIATVLDISEDRTSYRTIDGNSGSYPGGQWAINTRHTYQPHLGFYLVPREAPKVAP